MRIVKLDNRQHLIQSFLPKMSKVIVTTQYACSSKVQYILYKSNAATIGRSTAVRVMYSTCTVLNSTGTSGTADRLTLQLLFTQSLQRGNIFVLFQSRILLINTSKKSQNDCISSQTVDRLENTSPSYVLCGIYYRSY